MNTALSFGEWLKRRRRTLDLTQEELAQEVGCSAITIRKIEADERRPSKQLAALMAEYLNVAPEEQASFITFARAKPYIGPSTPPSDLAEPLPWQTSPPEAGDRPMSTPSRPLFLTQRASPEKPSPVFVARARELSELEATLDTARNGAGQILFVIGGAGRGKTMLVQEFARRAQATQDDLVVISGYCNAHTGIGDPYLPFREALTMLTGDVEAKWAGGLISQHHARQLWELMPIILPALVKHAPDLIGSFVPGQALQARAATFAPDDAPWFKQLATLTADEHSARLDQKRIFAQYTAVLKTISAQQPLLVIIEDLHWVDTASSGLLFHLSRQVSDSPILMVGTYRPEEMVLSRPASPSAEYQERHPLADIVSELKRRHGDIWLDLGELALREGRQFVEAYLDTEPNQLGEAFREALFRHTGGHALFTVELLRDMQERGDLWQDENGRWLEGEAIDWQTLPAKVEGVIEKRIEQLAEALQAVLNVASVEGETFTAEVVARVQQLDERSLVQQLSRELDKQHRLVTAQALERLDPGGQRLSLYRFRHHLFQHYLYHNLDDAERTYLHEAVGTALETLYAGQTEKVAVQLVRHYEQAGLIEKTVVYLRQAGERATRLSANEEAIEHFTRALGWLKTLPDSPGRAQQEITLQLGLGNALIATKGYAVPEVEKTYRRARDLGQQLGETLKHFPVLVGLHRFYLMRAEFQLAREMGEQMLRLARSQQDPTLRVIAHRAMGVRLYFLGEFAAAQEHLEQGIALYDRQQHRSYLLLGGNDEGQNCLSYAALTLWHLGYPDQALERSHESITLAQKLSYPFTLAFALLFAARLHQFRREGQAVQKWTEATIMVSTEWGFPFWLAQGTFMQGWALADKGDIEEGITLIQQGLAAWQAIGVETGHHYILVLLAEAYGKAGQAEEGLKVLAEALARVAKYQDCYWEAELYRLKGELLLNASREGGKLGMEDESSPEACFLQAIEVARRQKARSLELRATVSLSRLWQQQGRREEARQMLAEIYNWFTEGFDTVDLKEAKVLLEELSSFPKK